MLNSAEDRDAWHSSYEVQTMVVKTKAVVVGCQSLIHLRVYYSSDTADKTMNKVVSPSKIWWLGSKDKWENHCVQKNTWWFYRVYQEGIPPLNNTFLYIHELSEEHARRQSQEQKDMRGWGGASAGCHQDSCLHTSFRTASAKYRDPASRNKMNTKIWMGASKIAQRVKALS